jgi:hypothetical protein
MVSTRSKSRRFVSTREAASIAGLSTHALSRRVQAGAITQYRDPSDYRVRLFDVAELEQFLRPRPTPREEVAVS